MQTSLRGIANKARKEKKHRFRHLYTMLNETNLRASWKYVRKNAASGADRLTAKEYGKHLDLNLSKLVEQLKRGSYRAKLVLRKWIPKDKNKRRPLGLPVVEDKLLQTAVARILTAIFEADFLPFSFGYRPKRGARQAALELKEKLHRGRFRYVVEADIKGFFNNIDHDWMIRMLEQRIDDRPFLRLIKKWLKAGILEEDGRVIHPITGTPQGGIVSPVLANIYLHYALDLWYDRIIKPGCRGMVYMCRYADDFVCIFENKADAYRFYNSLGARLGKFNLELSKEKTNLIGFSRFPETAGATFEFLGFIYYWSTSRKGKKIVKLVTSRKKFQHILAKLTEWVRRNRHKRIRKLMKQLNRSLRGHYNYFGVMGNYEKLNELFRNIRRILFKWLNRRSQRKSFNWKQYDAMLRRHKIEKPRITQRHNGQQSFEFVLADCGSEYL